MAEEELVTPKQQLISNGLFDALKFVAQILLPAAGTLYFALAGIWHLPNANEVVGTIVAVDTFLGVLLGLQSKSYNNSDARFDGVMHVVDTPDKTRVTMELHDSPDNIIEKDSVLFKVKPSVGPDQVD